MLLERLRQETSPYHRSLEAVIPLPSSLEAYQGQLRGFLGFVEPWEQSVARSRFAGYLSGREKTAWLRQDLHDAGLDETTIAQLPRCRALPLLESEPAVLGSLYVMEGSTLGGQMISRHLETSLGLRDGRGYAYHRSYGPDVPRRWQEMRALLSTRIPASDHDTAVAAAQSTFAALQTWFQSRVP